MVLGIPEELCQVCQARRGTKPGAHPKPQPVSDKTLIVSAADWLALERAKPPQLDDYEVLSEIARGGMGVSHSRRSWPCWDPECWSFMATATTSR